MLLASLVGKMLLSHYCGSAIGTRQVLITLRLGRKLLLLWRAEGRGGRPTHFAREEENAAKSVTCSRGDSSIVLEVTLTSGDRAVS